MKKSLLEEEKISIGYPLIGQSQLRANLVISKESVYRRQPPMKVSSSIITVASVSIPPTVTSFPTELLQPSMESCRTPPHRSLTYFGPLRPALNI